MFVLPHRIQTRDFVPSNNGYRYRTGIGGTLLAIDINDRRLGYFTSLTTHLSASILIAWLLSFSLLALVVQRAHL